MCLSIDCVTYTAGGNGWRLGAVNWCGLWHGKGSAEESGDDEGGGELHVYWWDGMIWMFVCWIDELFVFNFKGPRRGIYRQIITHPHCVSPPSLFLQWVHVNTILFIPVRRLENVQWGPRRSLPLHTLYYSHLRRMVFPHVVWRLVDRHTIEVESRMSDRPARKMPRGRGLQLQIALKNITREVIIENMSQLYQKRAGFPTNSSWGSGRWYCAVTFAARNLARLVDILVDM